MTLFLGLFMIIIILITIKTNYKVFFNELFWMFIFWGLIIGVYIFSGVEWRYCVSIELLFYLLIVFLSFMFGRKYGYTRKVKAFYQKYSPKNLNIFCLFGLLGVLLFTIDYIRLNGLFTVKSGYNISIIGSLGYLLIPILLIVGLYIFAINLIDNGKINIKAILLLIAYSIPCILNSGRESIVFIIIGIGAIYGYYAYFIKKSYRYINLKKFLVGLFIVFFIICTVCFIVHISKERFGDNEVSTFLNTHSVKLAAIREAETWGNFDFLYYNIASYFSHQLSFLEFIFKEYHGPYMFGMYELNIISRRLPTILDLDYNLVYQQLRQLYLLNGVSYSGDWFTILGSLIVDFGRFGSIVFMYFCGYFCGIVKKKINLSNDIRYVVLRAIICICMFSSIQLGPFYNILIYGAFIWWLIIFREKEIMK